MLFQSFVLAFDTVCGRMRRESEVVLQVRFELLLDTCGMQLEALAGEIEMIRDEVMIKNES